MPEHVLTGCRPEPMSAYLRGLAVLRLVSEQADPDATGRWSDRGFVLETHLDAAQLEGFFVHRWRPTPVVSPWNGGSGFYANDDTSGRDAILASTTPRLRVYRQVIRDVLGWPELPPRYDRVADVLAPIRTALALMKPSQGRNQLARKLAGAKDAPDELLRDLDRPRDDVPLDLLEGLSGTGAHRGEAKALWATVKRARKLVPTATHLRDLPVPLGAHIEGLRASKKRRQLQADLVAVQAAHPHLTALLRVATTGAIPLSHLEALAGSRCAVRSLASPWWGAVKKARNEANQRHRDRYKAELLVAARARLPDAALPWLDTAIVLQDDAKPAYNPLLGSGGNEGHLDYSNHFMQHVVRLLGEGADMPDLLRASLWARPTTGLVQGKTGQLDPGRAGGYNQGAGVEAKDFTVNPWDFVLMLEGSMALSAAATRRHGRGKKLASVPFTVGSTASGYTSSTSGEAPKAEAWLPLWERPTTWRELRHLLGEGRSTVGRRAAATGLDFARAVGTLGVDRGLDAFTRYAFVQRRGDSMVALPAGRVRVRHRPEVRLLDLLDAPLARLDAWLRRFTTVPASLAMARRGVEQAQFRCAESPSRHNFTLLTQQLGRVERLVSQRARTRAPTLRTPLGGLTTAWLRQCEATPEVRVAAALASIVRTGPVGPLRANTSGVDAAHPWAWASGGGQRHWHGRNLAERLLAVLSRRLLDAERLGAGDLPLAAHRWLRPPDVVPFLYGDTDDALLEDLLFGFTWITDWREPRLDGPSLEVAPVPRSWTLLRLVHLPTFRLQHIGLDLTHRAEPRVLSLLRARQTRRALDLARHRLRVQGMPVYPLEPDPSLDPVRLAASLLIPTSPRRVDVQRILPLED